ncbi:B-cell receptor CD22-like, partial [Centroberyx affinis]|uniref:B-cell receptor CD22-like n=1 Tax=Centroberyx affinis TaxID=166261 RepID=UPI003A5BCB1C
QGSSVTLTCRSDANPAATYTWYKENGNPEHKPFSTEPQLHFVSIQSSDSGEYYCAAENELGGNRSAISINVKYGPKNTSVLVSPSGEILEGSSVTLTCSSDANPAATYTWYKENEASLIASEQIFTITDLRPEHSGNYSCEAHNSRGRHTSTLQLTVVADTHQACPVCLGMLHAKAALADPELLSDDGMSLAASVGFSEDVGDVGGDDEEGEETPQVLGTLDVPMEPDGTTLAPFDLCSRGANCLEVPWPAPPPCQQQTGTLEVSQSWGC